MIRTAIDFLKYSLLGTLVVIGIEAGAGASSSGSGLMVTVIAALVTGQSYGRRQGHVPSKGACWMVGVWLTLVSTVVFGLIAFVTGAFDDVIGVVGGGALVTVMLIALAASTVIIRFAFRWGASQTAVEADERVSEVFR